MNEEDREVILSRRNQKRFNKLTLKFEEKIKTLEEENQNLVSEIDLMRIEIEASKAPEVTQKKNFCQIMIKPTTNI